MEKKGTKKEVSKIINSSKELFGENATLPIRDVNEKRNKGNVATPTENGVDNAKEWVDNGSKL